ncbi:transcriptional regulator [Jeotgalibacillus alimentarius]|uniref:Transcriptional regulatory protein n=2 Tax=Jeotgalibacillus TaxID=157226 RepID=A0A0C2W686_9BACL|nr:transcriptional regulator [Jeotgalibacillus alimentarius]MBM7578730.1 CitB family two-component system response regulator CitT [Jeotgalibacillus terrae]
MKVAIAEDDFRVASIHEQFLEKLDHIKVTGKALNAKEALELLEQEETDLLLLDNYLPDRTGLSLLPEIRERWPGTDVILITASTEKEVVEPAVRYGAADYIVKPVTFERFKSAIEKVRKRKQLIDSNHELTQAVIDQMFSNQRPSETMPTLLPKGIDPLTLQKVKDMMRTLDKGINAEELGQNMGASRTTARRYLEYMISSGEAKAELEYGIVGRPERKYYLA